MKTILLAALAAAVTFAQNPTLDLKASMIVIGVKDLARAAKFYRETLGLPAAPAPGDLPVFRAGSLTIVLNSGLSGEPGSFELVFPVDSVTAVRTQLADRGCHFIADSREVAPNLWTASFTDPDGHRLTLFGAR